jgi:hypothetical protein
VKVNKHEIAVKVSGYTKANLSLSHARTLHDAQNVLHGFVVFIKGKKNSKMNILD